MLTRAGAVCAVPFFAGPAPGRHPANRSAPPGRSARAARPLNFQNKGRIVAALRCKPGASRAAAAGSRFQGRGGWTTAAVRRAARPGQPATALTFRSQATERHCHDRRGRFPQGAASGRRALGGICGNRGPDAADSQFSAPEQRKFRIPESRRRFKTLRTAHAAPTCTRLTASNAPPFGL